MHRHLTHQQFTLAAIDDVIDRGKRRDWAELQSILPDAVIVGGTAAAPYADHRLSTDANHVLPNLQQRFDQVLAELESVSGWKTARIKRPVQIIGNLDGIETGVRQLIRDEPLETTEIEYLGQKITIPTQAEILRIKGVLILRRNANAGLSRFRGFSRQNGRCENGRGVADFRSFLSSAERRIGVTAVADSARESAPL